MQLPFALFHDDKIGHNSIIQMKVYELLFLILLRTSKIECCVILSPFAIYTFTIKGIQEIVIQCKTYNHLSSQKLEIGIYNCQHLHIKNVSTMVCFHMTQNKGLYYTTNLVSVVFYSFMCTLYLCNTNCNM